MIPDISLVLITFFFSQSAQLPTTLPLFLLSVSYNPSIEFRIVSNVPRLNIPQPENLQLVYMSHEDIRQKLRSRLNVTRDDVFTASFPYKLCDFKPMFGIIFDEIVKGFEFWGHVDNDMILSDLLSEEFIDPRFEYFFVSFSLFFCLYLKILKKCIVDY